MEGLMRPRLGMCAISLVVLGALAAGAAARGPASAEPTVSCDRIVLRGNSGLADGFRLLLGRVSMPGSAHLGRDADAVRSRSWRYYRNAGLAIRAGTSGVVVSVPDGWRERVALSWGGSRPSSSIRFPSCPRSAAGIWNSFSGGFHLRGRADCVPLLVTVGGMSTTVRVGIGRACGESH